HYLDSSFGRRIASNSLNFRIQGRFRDFAFINVHHQPVIRTDEANIEALLEFVPLASNHDSIAIAIRLRTWDHRRHDVFWKSSHSLEGVRHLFALNLQLAAIGNVLVLTTSTISEIGTWGDNPLG